MGNEQSTESSVQPKEEEPEQTDLSDIPDDREPDESTIMPESPEPVKSASNGKTQRKKKKKKKRKGRRSTGEDTQAESSGELSRVSQHVPDDEEIQALREREPEAFSVYASSQVGDVDDVESSALHDTRATNSADVDEENEVVVEESPPRVNGHLSAEDMPVEDEVPPPRVTSDIQATQDELIWADSTQSVPEPKHKGDRWLCPYAEVYDCEQTFAKKKAAKRHAAIHTPTFVCSVCGKNLSRKDTLDKHFAKHSTEEIASAEAQVKTKSEPVVVATAFMASMVDDQLQEVQGEKSPEYTTPRETVQAQPYTVDSVEDAGSESVRKNHARDEESADDTMIRAVEDAVQDQLDARSESTRQDELSNGDQDLADATDPGSEGQSSGPRDVMNDQAQDGVLSGEPAPEARLKRKRASDELSKTPNRSAGKSSKRRKQAHDATPPSGQSKDEGANSGWAAVNSITESTGGGQVTDKIVPTLQKRQSTIDGWTQRSSSASRPSMSASRTPPPSTTRHVEVLVPRTNRAATSGIFSVRAQSKSANGNHKWTNGKLQSKSLENFGAKRARNATYTTPKGKKPAEAGVNYLSPAVDTRQRAEGDGSDSDPANMATSVAKRTFSSSQSRKRARAQDEGSSQSRKRQRAQDEESMSEYEEEEAEKSEEDALKKISASQRRPRANSTVKCGKCHMTFKSEASLRSHLKQPNVHARLHGCEECSEQFYSMKLLAKHEKDTGHGKGNGLQGLTGPFSEREVQKLENWRDTFCEDHSITTEQFNDMMTDTLKRQKGDHWNWRFISKRDFLNEYYDILPDRNRRSMNRYRERNFQNLGGSKDWTAQDDEELLRLYKQLGPKWTEIGQRMMRTFDAVAQRWRHKLRHGHNEKGEWTAEEKAKFSKAIEEVRRLSGVAADSEGWHIPWNKVSEKVGTRSAIQCSNHYRAAHSKKHQGRWVKVEGLEKTPGSSRILTPSKMERRLKGEKVASSSKRMALSQEIVRDEDEEDEDGQIRSSPVEDEGTSEQAEDEESAEESSSRQNRNPLQAKTPSKTLQASQMFGQTQANTSAIRPFPQSRRKQLSQDRPSPNIPIQRQQLSARSPLSEIKVKANGDLDLEGEENESAEDVDEQAYESEARAESDKDADEGYEATPGDEQAADSDVVDEGEANDEESDGDADEEASNDFLSSIKESALRGRLKLQPAKRNGLHAVTPSSRRRRWSLSPSDSESGGD
ncbi:hypothetical protein LTR72_005835 [Exophiala xenobiotica]|nr:hypothetical protein LTR92_006101 [Exophiala xenobiotica]KAK5222998.1 hypothetical protein LTR72_005835 [Exophiala xenobiotica]KAK5297183.1 hypothetical protein LTR14_002914 [Exophiala xenobiotica]KAK5485999.1 hypothetical protein LTR55_005677 [Exophiala xenobiotica]